MTENLFSVVDIETTGTDPENDAIIEIAAIDIENGALSEYDRESYVKSPIPIPPQASGVHHITDEHLTDAPPARAIIPVVLKPESGAIFVAHNAKFEQAFLKQYVGDAVWICTYKCALRLWPDVADHKNQTLRYFLKLRLDPKRAGSVHSASFDAYVAANIFLKMLETTPVEKLIEWSAEPPLLPRCPIGKEWRGKSWPQVEYGFLSWCLNNIDDEDTLWNVKHELSRRADAQTAEREEEQRKKEEQAKLEEDKRIVREGYITLAKPIIAEIKSRAELEAWFKDNKELREEAGVVKGTAEYKQLSELCISRVALLAHPEQQPVKEAA